MSLGKAFVSFLKLWPQWAIKPVAFRYVAGETLEQGLAAVRALNSRDITATVDVLGESAKDADYVHCYINDYKAVMDAIVANRLRSGVSIKPTAFGLAFDQALARRAIREVIQHAHKNGLFLRIDMEDSPYTTVTLEMYKQLRDEFPRVGVVLQAYLRRTMEDIESLGASADVRLCKGIYIEPPHIAYKGYQEVRDNYVKCLRRIFEKGYRVGIATHDQHLIDRARELIRDMKIPCEQYEFQMLYGVRGEVARVLRQEGHRMRVYVPYGRDWYAYSMRRLYENPNVAWNVTKAVVADSACWVGRALTGRRKQQR